MSDKSSNEFMRTIIFIVLAVPVIWYLVQFSMKRNNQFEGKAQACELECTEKGYAGSEFKWAALSKSECVCLEEGK